MATVITRKPHSHDTVAIAVYGADCGICEAEGAEAEMIFEETGEYPIIKEPVVFKPRAKAGDIVLEAHICTERRSYPVVFAAGPKAEQLALSFIAKRIHNHVICEWDAQEFPLDPEQYPALYDVLHPICEHGLSAHLCMGPQHWMSDEQERQMAADFGLFDITSQ